MSGSTAAVIVNYDGLCYLRRNLRSWSVQSKPFSAIIVVDNGSCDGSMEFLLSQDGVETISLGNNLGFAGGANRGIKRALGKPGVDYVALINNDVALEPDWHKEARHALRMQNEFGSCATCLVREGDKDVVDTAGIIWSAKGFADNFLAGQPHPDKHEPPREIWGACAAAALYRRSFFETTGLFDESLFAYQEDVDLALRGRNFGWRTVFAPAARGSHQGFGSNKPFPLGGTYADFYNARNRITVAIQSRPGDEWRRQWRYVFHGVLLSLFESFREGRAAAVWAGTAQAFLRIPGSLRTRRALAVSIGSETKNPSTRSGL